MTRGAGSLQVMASQIIPAGYAESGQKPEPPFGLSGMCRTRATPEAHPPATWQSDDSGSGVDYAMDPGGFGLCCYIF